jgi:hypothetical protein
MVMSDIQRNKYHLCHATPITLSATVDLLYSIPYNRFPISEKGHDVLLLLARLQRQCVCHKYCKFIYHCVLKYYSLCTVHESLHAFLGQNHTMMT